MISRMTSATMDNVHVFSNTKSCTERPRHCRVLCTLSSRPSSPAQQECYLHKKECNLEIEGGMKRSPLAEYMAELGFKYFDTNPEGPKTFGWNGKSVTEQELVDCCRERGSKSLALIKEIREDCMKLGIDIENNLKYYKQYRRLGLEEHKVCDLDADLSKLEIKRVQKTEASSV